MCNSAKFRYDGVIDSPLRCSGVITSPVMIHTFPNCSDIIHVGNTRFNSHTLHFLSWLSRQARAANVAFILNVL